MPQPNGRVQAGEPISKAFSARAWNRAQAAADIVLGSEINVQPSTGRPTTESVVCRLALTSQAYREMDDGLWPLGLRMEIGCSIGMPVTNIRFGGTFFPPAKSYNWSASTEYGQYLFASEADIPRLDKTSRVITLRNSFHFGSDTWGIVEDITRDDGYVYYRVLMRGIVTCRLMAWGASDRAMCAVPLPPVGTVDEQLRNEWRPYPTMSGAGSAAILAYGGAYLMRGAGVEYPRVVEAMLSL